MREVRVITPYSILSTAWFRGRSFVGLMGSGGAKSFRMGGRGSVRLKRPKPPFELER
jgi:hypothetical protein